MQNAKKDSKNTGGKKNVQHQKAKYNPGLSQPEDIVNLISPLIRSCDDDIAIVVGLDSKNSPVVLNAIATGSFECQFISMKEVIKPLVLSDCSSFIFVHYTHKKSSGKISPESDERLLTEKLRDAGNVFKIRLIDHIIIGRNNNFFSFFSSGLYKSKNGGNKYD